MVLQQHFNALRSWEDVRHEHRHRNLFHSIKALGSHANLLRHLREDVHSTKLASDTAINEHYIPDCNVVSSCVSATKRRQITKIGDRFLGVFEHLL